MRSRKFVISRSLSAGSPPAAMSTSSTRSAARRGRARADRLDRAAPPAVPRRQVPERAARSVRLLPPVEGSAQAVLEGHRGLPGQQVTSPRDVRHAPAGVLEAAPVLLLVGYVLDRCARPDE